MRLSQIGQKKLEQKWKQDITEATQLLLEKDNPAEAEKKLHGIRLCQELQAQYDTFSKNNTYFFIIAVICGIIISFLSIYPCQNTRVRLNLDLEVVTLNLEKDFKWNESLPVSNFFLEGSFTIESYGLGISGNAERLHVNGSDLSITELVISEGAAIEIVQNKDSLDIYIYKGYVNGIIELSNGKIFLQGDDGQETQSIKKMVPESFQFTRTGNHGYRLHISFKIKQDWKILYGLQITDIRFQQEIPPNSNNFISSIRKGTIEIPESNSKIELMEYDSLHLHKAKSTRFRLHFHAKNSENFNIFFQGWASSIIIGADDFKKDITPSLIIWIYHQKQLALFWCAFLFIYTLIIRIRSRFF